MSGARRRSRSRTSTGREAYVASGRPRAPGSRGSQTGREARGPDRRARPVAGRESRARRSSYGSPSSCQYLLMLPILSLALPHLRPGPWRAVLRLLCNLVSANRQSPVVPDEMAGVAVGISLEIVLMLGFGLPEVVCRNDFRNDLARPQPRCINVGNGVF